MTDYFNEFTPDWPHGHVIVYADGITTPFVVKVTDWPGEFPIRGHEVGGKETWFFHENGTSRGAYYHLRNAAPPKRVPRERWVNVYKSGYSFPHKSRSDADEAALNGRIECIHFREVIEEAEPEPGEKLPDGFDLAVAKESLLHPSGVDWAFNWSSTQQGQGFWARYYEHSITRDDAARAREALKRWIAIAERKKEE